MEYGHKACIACGGKCGLSRLQCLKKRNCEMTDDRKIMKSLEKRYDSWMQARKEGRNPNNVAYFMKNAFEKRVFDGQHFNLS